VVERVSDARVVGLRQGQVDNRQRLVGVGVAAIPFSCADCPGGLRGVVGDSLNRRLYADENEPVLSLGYGLSYTTFSFSHLSVSPQHVVSFDVTNTGSRGGAEVAQVSQSMGARKLGYNVTRIDPKKAAYPAHNHRVNEEMFLVLDGTGELRAGDERFPIRKGDIVGGNAVGCKICVNVLIAIERTRRARGMGRNDSQKDRGYVD